MTFTTETATLPGGPITYRKGGSGRPLLLIHGTSGPSLSPVAHALTQRHTIYQTVMPGWDGTPQHDAVTSVKDLADVHGAFIKTVIGGPCDVIGTSFGGWVAAWTAARHPTLVDQLILSVTGGMRDPGTGGLPTDPDELRRQLYAHPERAPKPVRTTEAYWINRNLRDKIAAGISHDQELEHALGKITARTLIVFGTKDKISPSDVAGPRLKRGITHSHVAFVYDAAHSIEFDQPERVGRLFASFLERGEGFLVRSDSAA